MSKIKILLTALLFAAPVSALAQDSMDESLDETLESNGVNLEDPAFESTVREKYVRTAALPDGIAFQTLINNMVGINKKRPSFALNMIRKHMDLDGAEGEAFLAIMTAEHASLRREAKAEARDLICSQGIPKVSGPQVYVVLDAVDDSDDRVAAKHLEFFRQGLEADQAEKLDQWIARTKMNTVHIKFDHKKRFEQQQSDPDAVVATLCG